MNLGMETDDPLPFGNLRWTRMILSESGNGSGANRTRSITEKIAVFAPMPSARARTATMVKPGLLIRTRKEWRTSANRVSIIAYTKRRTNWFPPIESLLSVDCARAIRNLRHGEPGGIEVRFEDACPR